MRYLLSLSCILFCSLSAVHGQITPPSALSDTTGLQHNEAPLRSENDNQVNVKEIDTYADHFVPRKASLYSAILPGLGQVYNRSYWKIPIIYGGFIALGYTINFYNNQYKDYRSDLFTLLEEGGTTSPLGFDEEQIRTLIDKSRRERDFYMIMTGILYLMQIAEAHIDAHLKEFKLNPDLKVSLEPTVEQTMFTSSYNAGLSLKFRF